MFSIFVFVMKKIIVYTLFYIGDLVWRSGLINMEIGYEVYQFFMIGSSDLQEKYGLDEPWKNPK